MHLCLHRSGAYSPEQLPEQNPVLAGFIEFQQCHSTSTLTGFIGSKRCWQLDLSFAWPPVTLHVHATMATKHSGPNLVPFEQRVTRKTAVTSGTAKR